MNLVNEKKISNSEIISIAEASIDALCNDYRDNSSYYFTENDLVCKYYQIFTEKIGNFSVIALDKSVHKIIHMEYPTPFRCDMTGTNCILKSDNDPVKNGKGRYKRGHYDIAILNPAIIPELTYEDIRSQKYERVKKNVFPKIDTTGSMILFAIEFLLHRNKMSQDGANHFINLIKQDHLKLVKSKSPDRDDCGKPGFVGNHQTIAFYLDTSQHSLLEEERRKFEMVRFQPARV